jgi:hypothetical protein
MAKTRHNEIPKIKDIILETLGDDCEKMMCLQTINHVKKSTISAPRR